eukprot:gene48019-27253_t
MAMHDRTMRLVRVGAGSVAAGSAALRRCIGSVLVEVNGTPVATMHEMADAMRGRTTVSLRFRAARNRAHGAAQQHSSVIGEQQSGSPRSQRDLLGVTMLWVTIGNHNAHRN